MGSRTRYAGTICDINYPEGLAFACPADGKVKMIIVGEPTDLFIWEARRSVLFFFRSSCLAFVHFCCTSPLLLLQ